jgi:hypothetical protein
MLKVLKNWKLQPDLSGALFLFCEKRKKREPFGKLRINLGGSGCPNNIIEIKI